ncbi:MAG: hypothetical protein LBM25_03975 [Bacteroidales bacterium]|jgi:hypothetical protein|nr:hypothetical protein [Bacteroidales bacterium]
MRKLILAFFALFLSIFSFGQKISRDNIQIGDKVNYTFSLPIKDINLSTIYSPKQIKDTLEILGLKTDTITHNGEKYIEFEYTITSFVAGKHSINDSINKDIQINVIPINIDTTKLTIKDIHSNAEEPFTFEEIYPILFWVFLSIVFIVLIIVLYFLWKKYRKTNIKELFIKPKEKEPAHIIALNRLKALRLKHLVENNRIKEYYIEISDILREYLLNRYSISALEMTTDEILQIISNNKEVDDSELDSLSFILKKSDLVKFAKLIPDSFTSDKIIKDSISFIENTKLDIIEQEKKEEMLVAEEKEVEND